MRSPNRLAEVRLGAPEHRRLHAGGRRHVGAHRAEQLADEALGRPAREGDRAAGAADAEQLGGRRAWSGANIEPNTDVTASKERVREGQRLGVALQELDVEPLGGGAARGRARAGTGRSRRRPPCSRAAPPRWRRCRCRWRRRARASRRAGRRCRRGARPPARSGRRRRRSRRSPRPAAGAALSRSRSGLAASIGVRHRVSPRSIARHSCGLDRRYDRGAAASSAAATHLPAHAYLSGGLRSLELPGEELERLPRLRLLLAAEVDAAPGEERPRLRRDLERLAGARTSSTARGCASRRGRATSRRPSCGRSSSGANFSLSTKIGPSTDRSSSDEALGRVLGVERALLLREQLAQRASPP